MTGDRILIVGASAAGVSAGRTLRAEGFAGEIVLIDADPNPPYQRPPLSKQLLEGLDAALSDHPLLTLEEAVDLRIDLHLGQKVTALDTEAPAVVLADGRRLEGRAVVLATGGRARRLPLPGMALAGVHMIRAFSDIVALRSDLAKARTVAVIGGGLIGTEAAVSVAALGKRVIWLDAADRPLAHIFPGDVADHLVAAHLDRGLELRVGVRLSHLVERNGRVAGVALEDGEIVAADVVILGVGMSPCDELAREAGLACSNGVHVDERQRTSAENIYAAGDVAAFLDQSDRRVRHEHWRAAEHQGMVAARAILDLPPLGETPAWFWSDQGALHVEMAGRRSGDSLIRHGGKGPIVFEMDGDVVVGVASVDEPNAVRIGLRLIRSGRAVDRTRLVDPTQNLRELMQA